MGIQLCLLKAEPTELLEAMVHRLLAEMTSSLERCYTENE